MLLYPNCKINIGLRVVNKREDGYHNIETIFYPVYRFRDELEVNPAPYFQFRQEGIVVDCKEEDNLIIRCYQMLKDEFPQIGNLDIRFRKNIPFGAGLGGGSSDAAHMAIALNELYNLGLSKSDLAKRVSRLGADCAFFIYNTPCFAEGIGDILTPIELDLSNKRIIMIKPDIHVSTRDAYASISPNELPFDRTKNDFETTVFARYPLLRQIKERLLTAGAQYAAMSGSGSTIFGLFESSTRPERLENSTHSGLLENNTESGTLTNLRLLHEEFASMIIFDNSLSKA